MFSTEVQNAIDLMSQAIHTVDEAVSHAIARRILTQGVPLTAVGQRDAMPHVRQIVGKVAELASGIEVDRPAAQEALRAGQSQLAQDVLALFPGDSSMVHVSAQVIAKSQPRPEGGAQHVVVRAR